MAVNSVWNRKLKNVDYYVVMTYYGLLGLSCATTYICVEAAIKGEFRFYTGLQYLILISAGVMDMLATNCVTVSYQKDNSGFVSLISYGLIFYGFLSDVIIFDEKILLLELIGAVVILGSTMTVATIKLCESWRKRKVQF